MYQCFFRKDPAKKSRVSSASTLLWYTWENEQAHYERLGNILKFIASLEVPALFTQNLMLNPMTARSRLLYHRRLGNSFCVAQFA